LGKILIADGNPDFRELIIFALRFAGYIVSGASSGEECVRVARKFRPDIILMDANFSDKNGYDACKALKVDDDTVSIAVILMLEAGMDPKTPDGIEDCRVEIMIKPIDPDQLTEKVNSLMK
jgi:DNA-binding response OmpR family regulator